MLIVVLVVAIALGLSIARRFYRALRQRMFLQSRAYYDAHAALSRICAVMKKTLARPREIGEDLASRLMASGRRHIEFLEAARFDLDPEDQLLMRRYHNFSRCARLHDAEVFLLQNFGDAYEALFSQSIYISCSEMLDLRSRVSDAYSVLSQRGADEEWCLSDAQIAFERYKDIEAERVRHNDEFVKSELSRFEAYFNGLEKYALDVQQRTACVVDEDATLVIAGAGSGKTSTILSKVRYLVEKKSVPMDEILLISFTKKSAEDVSNRLSKHIGNKGRIASTFHSFGLELIRKFGEDGRKIVDNPDEFLLNFVHSSLGGDGTLVAEGYQAVVEFFAYYFNSEDFPRDGESMGDFFDRTRTMNFETLRSLARMHGSDVTLSGEKVRSLEEVLIANFLFLNGVDYEYEKEFPDDYVLPDGGAFRRYRPDFTLTGYKNVYLEHYAVDENGNPPNCWSNVEQEKYKQGIAWKREFHKGQNTICLESFSWWNQRGVFQEKLHDLLVKSGIVLKPRSYAEIWAKIHRNCTRQQDEFERLICAFICLFKSNGWGLEEFDRLISEGSPSTAGRRKSFLRVVRGVYEGYEARLRREGKIDFNDMINIAAELIRSGQAGRLPYRYVIVDEFQDISVGRMNLLRAVIQNTGAHLCGVGDDWQSIYRFAGSDNSLLVNYSSFFPGSVLLKIENTYRNSQELIDVMGRFVMKNPSQIVKELKSTRQCRGPLVPILYPTQTREMRHSALAAALGMIASETQGQTCVQVLLLGRTWYDSEKFLPPEEFDEGGLFLPTGKDWKTCRQYANMRVRFLTVHSSKGLEADYVILLNAANDLMGFPNRIADDPLLQLVLTHPEEYEFAEERRLFYVAMTRTKMKAFLLVPRNAPSPFVDELLELGSVQSYFVGEAGLVDGVSNAHCPKCQKGLLIPRCAPNGGYFCGCSNYPRCDYTVNSIVNSETPKCPKCGGFLVQRTKKSNKHPFLGCSNYPICRFTKGC